MDIATLQRLAARTWPGLEQQRLGEWELRAAGGFTGRANSALAVGDPGLELPEALQRVRDWYGERGLNPRLQVPAALEPETELIPAIPRRAGQREIEASEAISRLCDAQGWAAEPWTLVMVRSATHSSRESGMAVGARLRMRWADRPDDTWLDLYHYRGSQLPATARRVITAAPAHYLTADLDAELVGIGRAAVAGDVVVLTAIEVVTHHRRRGIGAEITEALAAKGAEAGASLSVLQVFAHNDRAVSLYRKLGYLAHHRYRYRYLPPADAATAQQ